MMRTGRRVSEVLVLFLLTLGSVLLVMADTEESISFGSVPVGQLAARAFTFTVLATSETAAQVTISTPCPPFGLAGLESQSMTLNPGQSVTFDVTFTPTAAIDYTCHFTIEAAGGYPVQVKTTYVYISGRGIGGGEEEERAGLPSVSFALPWQELLQTEEASSGSGVTDEEGRFEVSIPPATTVAGRLSECGGGELAGVDVQVAALEGTYGVAVSGYSGIEVDPGMSFSLFGMTSVDLGELCVELLPPAKPLTIRLLSPLAGEGLVDGVVLGPLCWESLGIEEVTYQVLEHSKTCDPEVVEGPHPFAPLIPDPELDRRERELRQELDRLQEQLRLQSPFCENLARSLDQLRTVHAGVPERLDGLRRMIDDASAAETGGLVIPLPSNCPVDAETYLAPDSSALMDLQYPPCPPGDPCRGLGDALASILSRIQSLQAHADVAYGDAKAEVDNWVAWESWRGSLELMHDMYSLVDEAIGFVDEVLSPLTGLLEDVVEEVRSAIMREARRYLTDEACARYPQACQMLEAAESAEELIGAVRGIMAQARRTGSLSPAFLVQMVQAMAQQVANVTGRALEEWESYARNMAAMIQEAYESYLCLQCAIEWLLGLEDEILALCEACLDCLRTDIADVEGEIAEVDAEQQAAAEARQEYWQEQQVQIWTAIGQVGQHLDPSWYDACCRPSPFTLTIPGESACAQELEDALKMALGDRVCFLEFHCTIDCQFDSDGAVSSAAVNCTYDFPLAERRPCCCVPWERYERPIGTESDPGRPGETVCHPPALGSMTPGPDGWSVEGLDASGEPIASSPRRPFGLGGVTAPRPIPRVPPSPKACICSATASINGFPLTAGGPTLLWQMGAPASVASKGDCGPECTAGSMSISVVPPVIPPLVPGGTGFAPLPVSVTTPSMGYDFPREGTYAVTVTQFCEDGQQCSATYPVEVIAPPGPVARHPGADPQDAAACPACGSNDCLSLAYRTTDEPPSMPALMHFVPIVAGSRLHLELTSWCRLECEDDRAVRWEFTRPNGMLDALEAADLYEIDYSFDEPGTYELCVIETIECDGGLERFENWWQFEATDRE